jgi:hypothetical protein
VLAIPNASGQYDAPTAIYDIHAFDDAGQHAQQSICARERSSPSYSTNEIFRVRRKGGRKRGRAQE